MGVRFACHVCGKELNIKSELAGKRGKCPACEQRFRIPREDQPLSIPLEEPNPLTLGGAYDDGDSEEDEFTEQDDSPAIESSEPAVEESSANFDPLAAAGALWYVRPPGGGRYGPADGVTIRQWIGEGRVTGNTLLWREGWAQWRECIEMLPADFPKVAVQLAAKSAKKASRSQPPVSEPIESTKSDPPKVRPENALPEVNVRPATGPASLVDAPATTERFDPDSYLGAKKKRKARQRATLIGILVGTAVLLVIALVVAIVWSR